MCFLEVPHKTSSALETFLTQLAVELGRVGFHTADKVVLHSVHRSTLKLTLLNNKMEHEKYQLQTNTFKPANAKRHTTKKP